MHPASRLVRPDSRPASIVPKLLSLAAAMVLLLATLQVFSVLKPAEPHYAQGGVVLPYCPSSMGGKGGPPPRPWDICHLFVPDQRVPLRVGIGVGALVVMTGLMVAATRAGHRPRLDPA